MSAAKSSAASLAKALRVKRERKVKRREKRVEAAEEGAGEAAAAEEEVRWSRTSRKPVSRSHDSKAGSGTLRDKGFEENTIAVFPKTDTHAVSVKFVCSSASA